MILVKGKVGRCQFFSSGFHFYGCSRAGYSRPLSGLGKATQSGGFRRFRIASQLMRKPPLGGRTDAGASCVELPTLNAV